MMFFQGIPVFVLSSKTFPFIFRVPSVLTHPMSTPEMDAMKINNLMLIKFVFRILTNGLKNIINLTILSQSLMCATPQASYLTSQPHYSYLRASTGFLLAALYD